MSIAGHVRSFFLAPRGPLDLAVGRILFCGGVLALHLTQDFAAWGEVSDVFYLPTPLFEIARLPVLDPAALAFLAAVWKLALLAACVGLHARASCAVAALVGFYLLGIPHSMGKVDHFDAIVVFVLAILALARSGDMLSVDVVLRRRRGEPAATSVEYTWPIRFVWITLALVFFSAGLSKLVNGGVDWVTSENMALVLVKQHYFASTPDPLVDWGLEIARRPWLYQPLAALTVMLELAYPLALVSRRLRWILVPGMLGAQLAIRVLLGPWFPAYVLATLFWVPWERLLVRRAAGRGPALRLWRASRGGRRRPRAAARVPPGA